MSSLSQGGQCSGHCRESWYGQGEGEVVLAKAFPLVEHTEYVLHAVRSLGVKNTWTLTNMSWFID